MKNALASVWEQYDYIFLDCPPSLGLITINALCASDSFLVPIQCEYYALEGLAQLTTTVRQIKRLYNPHIELEGVLLTMYDGRLNLTNQVVEEVKNSSRKRSTNPQFRATSGFPKPRASENLFYITIKIPKARRLTPPLPQNS